MNIVLITGAGGLIGSEAVEFFAAEFDLVLGIDNNMRERFFGSDASTSWNIERLRNTIANYRHFQVDIRDEEAIAGIYREYGKDVKLVVHAAAQPSHDWAAKEPFMDFTVNAN